MDIVALISGILSIIASIISIIMLFKTNEVKKECLLIQNKIINNNEKISIGSIDKFDNRKTF